jgi:hypothetical protein
MIQVSDGVSRQPVQGPSDFNFGVVVRCVVFAGLGSEPNLRQEITVADCFSAPSQGYAESVGDVLQKRAGAYLGPSPKREGSQGGTNSLRTS